SAAARRENVSTRRRVAGTPEPRRWATRRAKNSVLPVPGPARISWGPATSATASCQSAGWERTRASAGTDTRGDVRYGCGRADTSTQPRGRRSEERRVGKEGRSGWAQRNGTKKPRMTEGISIKTAPDEVSKQ